MRYRGIEIIVFVGVLAIAAALAVAYTYDPDRRCAAAYHRANAIVACADSPNCILSTADFREMPVVRTEIAIYCPRKDQ